MTAKEFYENQLHDKTTVVGRLEKDEIIELMQAYHESKLRESKIVESLERENQYLTDEDIQAWALKRVIIDMQPKSRINTASENAYKRGLIEAATAMRDGEIKHVSRDNDR